MGLFINTNVSALNSNKYLQNINKQLDTVYERLSSGLRINSAKDDAAGLQISNRLTTQINGLEQANRNANDGIALLQTMEGGLEEITNLLQEMRTLAVQGASDLNTEEDRDAISNTINELSSQIDDIVDSTTYGGQQILASGSGVFANGGKLSLQVGANNGDKIEITQSVIDSATLGVDSGSLGLSGTCGSTDFGDAIDSIDSALQAIDKYRGTLGAKQTALEARIRTQDTAIVNQSDARSRIRDADYAEESANLARLQALQQSTAAILLQANTRPQLAMMLLG